MAQNWRTIENDFLQSLKANLGQHWPSLSQYAVRQAKNITQTLMTIEYQYQRGNISSKEADDLLNHQRASTHTVFLLAAQDPIDKVSVEIALNNAFDAISANVNSSVGFELCSIGGGSRDH